MTRIGCDPVSAVVDLSVSETDDSVDQEGELEGDLVFVDLSTAAESLSEVRGQVILTIAEGSRCPPSDRPAEVPGRSP